MSEVLLNCFNLGIVFGLEEYFDCLDLVVNLFGLMQFERLFFILYLDLQKILHISNDLILDLAFIFIRP